LTAKCLSSKPGIKYRLNVGQPNEDIV